jgi:multidrug resistance efflux pump
LIQKVWDTVATQVKRMLGPGYLIRKAAAITILCLILFFSVFKIEYRVTAQTSLEGSIQRVIAAPFDGFIETSPVRPGDVIKKGQVMCLLDDRDLNLERIKWTTEKKQFRNQYNEAIAKHDLAQIRILNARIEQADAQISLLDEQLGRVKITAPFDSVVISGDLSQTLGSPVERGQVLFEVAPLDSFRVIAQVDERDIREIKKGQESELALPSMPGKTFPFIIKNLTLVTTAKEGRNFYRVEGEIQEPTPYLRPGMEGISKISIDRRRLIWVWTHKAIDWLRLKMWRWLP